MGSYVEICIGELVWVQGDDSNNYVSGFGLVVDRSVVHLEHCYMVDVMVLHNGKVYRPLRVSKLGG